MRRQSQRLPAGRINTATNDVHKKCVCQREPLYFVTVLESLHPKPSRVKSGTGGAQKAAPQAPRSSRGPCHLRPRGRAAIFGRLQSAKMRHSKTPRLGGATLPCSRARLICAKMRLPWYEQFAFLLLLWGLSLAQSVEFAPRKPKIAVLMSGFLKAGEILPNGAT